MAGGGGIGTCLFMAGQAMVSLDFILRTKEGHQVTWSDLCLTKITLSLTWKERI